ncbi:hypothetical protein SPF06_01550 [Sinomonas sp. JGH33]|uniref:Glycosyltransferase n=1 Tax=Sinomonas terricola TaxID=3110330 RepID=A0ABU5T2J4_9MICC|nr:hypothetical protein [Sinomonas sp. JGH33]MEA5453396.1 hypothetical protein [Sinomonas sp. JGH33]
MRLDLSSPRPVKFVVKGAAIMWIRIQNLLGRKPVTGAAPLAVSLTSYGERLATVGHTIESIARGTVRPKRLILWVDDPAFEIEDYPMLARLERRGLEILRCEDFGPHKKNYAYAREFADSGLPLVTADDDILYPGRWFEGLARHHLSNPGSFAGYRAHRVSLCAGGQLAPYREWRRAEPGDVGHDVFLTGGAGAVFPARLLRALRDAGESFAEVCPRADDIWINVIASRIGAEAQLLPSSHLLALSYPRSQRNALHHSNVDGGGNDRQLAASLTETDRARLVKAAALRLAGDRA